MLHEFLWLVLSGTASAVATWIVRRYALARGILDVPNVRSSHARPTPRGGGVAIFAVVMIGIFVLAGMGALDGSTLFGLVLPSGTIAAIGYLDDRWSLRAGPRFAVHAAAACLAVALLVPPTELSQFAPVLPAALAFSVLVLAIVWSINLFNFMDGIDGIAASQAMFMAGTTAAVIGITHGASVWSTLAVLTAGATAGFLVWNWPPAKIFMGDVGSGFLGFWLAVMALILHFAAALHIWTSIALGSLFIADSTVTLMRRMLSGQRWHQAHRSHAYQILARRFGSHYAVTGAAWALNLAIVLPCALLAQRLEQARGVIVCGLLILLGVTCFMVGAGKQPTPG